MVTDFPSFVVTDTISSMFVFVMLVTQLTW